MPDATSAVCEKPALAVAQSHELKLRATRDRLAAVQARIVLIEERPEMNFGVPPELREAYRAALAAFELGHATEGEVAAAESALRSAEAEEREFAQRHAPVRERVHETIAGLRALQQVIEGEIRTLEGRSEAVLLAMLDEHATALAQTYLDASDRLVATMREFLALNALAHQVTGRHTADGNGQVNRFFTDWIAQPLVVPVLNVPSVKAREKANWPGFIYNQKRDTTHLDNVEAVRRSFIALGVEL